MNSIKNIFSIKDLENFSGIKAHTIRIWEKRYQLLHPERTDTNIRYYSLHSLQKLLNVTLLYNEGFKISKLSKLTEEQIKDECKLLVDKIAVQNKVINKLKLSMLNFDTHGFEVVYQRLKEEKGFKQVFELYFLPFLTEIGMLWQTDSISPAHEHFMSELIKQKIQVEIEALQGSPSTKETTYILFLPEQEIHDLGLLYLNYVLRSYDYQVVYLGLSLPVDSLELFLEKPSKVTFICYSTVAPYTEKLEEYLVSLDEKISQNSSANLWFVRGNGALGKPTKSKVLFKGMFEVINHIEGLTNKTL